MKTALAITASILIVVILLVGLAVASFGTRWIVAPFRGAVEQREITNTGAYRIQNYERFYDIHQDVQSIDTKLNGYPQQLDIRQQTECQGLLAHRANLVAEYNAKARAIETTGQWQAEDLPRLLQQNNTRKC